MKKQDTCRLLRGIITAIDQVANLAGKYTYENFCQDSKARTMIAGYTHTIAAYGREIPTIIRVKYLLVPWKELDLLEETISRADPTNNPRILWMIGTGTLPQARLLLADMLRDMER